MKILKAFQTGRRKLNDDYTTYTHKECSCCKKVKPVSEFYKDKAKNNKLKWVYRSYCRECARKKCSAYAISNRPKRNKRLRDWRKKNPELAKQNDYRGRYKSLYKISIQQLELLKNANNGKCWICDKSKKRLVVDHDHADNSVRGALCDSCNHVVGLFENNLELLNKIIRYLSGKNPHANILLNIS